MGDSASERRSGGVACVLDITVLSAVAGDMIDAEGSDSSFEYAEGVISKAGFGKVL